MNRKRKSLATNEADSKNAVWADNATEVYTSRRAKIDRIKDKTDYKRFYKFEHPLLDFAVSESGWLVAGSCLFDSSCRKNSFKVSVESGRCCCDDCGGETDALGYAMLRHDLKFPGALRLLKETG